MRIESGPTRERIIRTAIPLIMFVVFIGWFGYDGWRGYPRKNLEEHLDQLPVDQRQQARAKGVQAYSNICDDKLTKDKDFEDRLKAALKSGSLSERRKALEGLLGEPPSWETPDAWYYFGPAARLKITVKDGLPVAHEVQHAEKTEVSLFTQKAIAIGLVPVALYLLGVMVRVLRTRLVLDETGLAYGGGGTISWDAMQALHTGDFEQKGWVDLAYREGRGERFLRLDEYHLARFDAIIDEICQRKGFENPLPVDDKPAAE